MTNTEARVYEIDGLRGIAILSVLVYHLWVLPSASFLSENQTRFLSLSAYGVDLFFVISGFLIGNIFRKMEGLSGAGAFYIRRVFRIWPLYYLLLFLVYLILANKSEFSEVPYWSFFFFIFNYWESFGWKINSALLILWSIAIEEQFYMIGPIIFSILNRRQIIWSLVGCIILSPLLRLSLVYYTDIVLWKFTPARIDGICIGLLLSVFLSSSKNILFVTERIKYLKTLTILLLFFLPPSIVLFPDHIWLSFGHSLIVLAFGCVLLAVEVQTLAGKKIWLLRSSFLRYLGMRCYSIYLFHALFHIFVASFSKNIYVNLISVSILVFTFAHFSWRYIEAPLIRLGRKFSYEAVAS